ncbi:hypothetical protein FY122_02090 [Dictyoglomus thermophilum]|uniref:hypothetical protein n=1 Tax=Dictyoglomus thermophilum TaxID=14 RepID=UPI0011EAF572|nr:hypothetical protein [Dictyoglomus thermophilum]TYT24348.1 hypothetical protein FY122_02090 [Dictyoglomus thermophilum]
MTANYIIETSLEEDKFIPLVKEEKEKSTPSYRRYPTRFILVDNFKNMRKLIEIMKKNGVETLDLSSLEISR